MGLINEINRIKTIMGIRLLVEGGGAIGDLSSFFGKLLTKNVDELSVEEREIAERMIKNSTELQSAGIKNLDQALSTQGKLLLKNTIKNSKENVINSLRKSIDDYSQEAIRIVNKNIESIPTFKSSLKNTITTQGSLLDVLKTIENEGLSHYNIPVLMQIRKKINSVSPNYGSNTDVTKYFKDIDDSIGVYINSKSIDFEKQIDDTISAIENKSINNYVESEPIEGIVGKYYKNIDQEYSGPQLPEITQMITKLDNTTKNLDFDLSKIKLIGQQIRNDRLIYELQHQDGTIFLMYKSTGSNVETTGKEVGTWWGLPGWANLTNYYDSNGNFVERITGWFIKDQRTLNLSLGDNPFLTKMKNFLEDNQNYKFNDEYKSSNKIIPTTYKNLLNGQRISNNSFNNSNIDWSNITNAKNMDDYNKFIANAIQTGDYSKISKSGFERYGIDNFREYLINNISKVNDVDPSIGRWSVNFK